MSTYPSTKTNAAYGTSAVDAPTTNKPTSHRRDSTAPLIQTPPIQQQQVVDDPLQVSSSFRNRSVISGSYARHSTHRSGLLRRRRNSESSSTESDEEEGRDSNVELNTSDEFDESESEEDESESDDEQSDNGIHVVARENQVEISGLNDIPQDTKDEQTLLLEEEDVQIHIMGYRYNRLNLFMYRVCSVLSLGIVWLVCRWVPRWYISWIGYRVPLKDAEWLVFKVKI
jgi:cation-transporting ATPase 13A3/4/5